MLIHINLKQKTFISWIFSNNNIPTDTILNHKTKTYFTKFGKNIPRAQSYIIKILFIYNKLK